MTQYVVKIDFRATLMTASTLKEAKEMAEKALQDGATEAVIEKHTSERVMVLTRKEAQQ